MKVGDYVRTKYGIKQIYEIDNNKTVWKYKFKLKKQDGDGCIDLGCFSDSDVIKSSSNIIDLIEVGDYVNGSMVVRIEEHDEKLYVYVQETQYCYACDEEENIYYKEDTIKSIVTKEQFSQMEYRIGE